MLTIFDFKETDEEVKIRNRIETIKDWEEKCHKYNTSLKSCDCKSYGFRKWCNHQGYIYWREEFIKFKMEPIRKKFFSDLELYSGNLGRMNDHYSEDFITSFKNSGEITELRLPNSNILTLIKLK